MVSGHYRECPEKITAFAHFHHDPGAWRIKDVMACVGACHAMRWRSGMKKWLLMVAAIAGLSILPSLANAQERLGDGAMGALAGALVGGPVGLVAGGVVGYTAGPSIASSWGLKGHRHYHRAHYRHTARNPP
jgi:hypothetical protein